MTRNIPKTRGKLAQIIHDFQLLYIRLQNFWKGLFNNRKAETKNGVRIIMITM